jgi:hypothetical protein
MALEAVAIPGVLHTALDAVKMVCSAHKDHALGWAVNLHHIGWVNSATVEINLF